MGRKENLMRPVSNKGFQDVFKKVVSKTNEHKTLEIRKARLQELRTKRAIKYIAKKS